MKHVIRNCAAIAALALAPNLWAADVNVGVSIGIGDPNFYGRIDIGDFPRPQLILPEPIIIERVNVVRAPMYLRVPPGHEKHWDKHCHEYGACGAPVYFVQQNWYTDVYAPGYRAKHGHGGGNSGHGNSGHGNSDHGHGKSKGKGGKGNH